MKSKINPDVREMAIMFQSRCGYGLPFSGTNQDMLNALDKAFIDIQSKMDTMYKYRTQLQLMEESMRKFAEDVHLRA